MRLIEQPYPHCIIQDFFTPGTLALLNGFAATTGWDFFEDRNFPQYISRRKAVENLFLRNPQTKTDLSRLFSAGFINKLQSLFDCSLQKCTGISFHKLVKGCFNVVHNDSNMIGEKIRMVCYLTEPENYEGGELNLFALEDQTTPVISYKFRSNSAFVFAMTENSIHSVNKVISGERICLVLTYQ